MPTRRVEAPSPRGGLLDPTNDLVFKLLLTGPESHDLLGFVLHAVLRPRVDIVDFHVVDPVLRPHELDQKEIVFDVHVAFADGTRVVVEMQCRRTVALRNRLAYYAARGLAEQLEPGEPYGTLQRSVVIAFLGYVEFADGPMHKRFQLLEVDSHRLFSDVLDVHTVELPKLRSLDASMQHGHDPLVLWSRFLTAQSETELRTLAAEAPAMKQAMDILSHLSEDEAVRRRAREREQWLALEAMGRRQEIALARAEGEAKGKADALLQVLSLRHPPVPPAMRERVLACTELATLDRWFERALTCSSADEVFQD